ncbi:MAG: B12-binding domain-containing radical SAM protein [Coriobacteriia bacterium]|nr:B12-binding domain-containing radical SAM protein [Coriobacteriia bacterium]
MRVLLIEAPVAIVTPHARLSPPLGLAYVAQHLLDDGHVVRILDLNVTGFNALRVQASLSRFRPDVVGISSHTETYPNAREIARIVKSYGSEIPVMLGGPHVSLRPHESLGESAIDYVVIGEGERTAVELVYALSQGASPESIREIAGLGHRVNDVPTLNSPRDPLSVLEIGRPARHLLSLEFYQDAHNVLVARGGCPYRCPFCSASQLWGGRRRPRPVEDILAEVDDVVASYGAHHVFFVDDILTVDRLWFEGLLDALAHHDAGITWGCATRVDCVDEDLLRAMAATGCTGIQYGVESGSQRILDSVKGIDKQSAYDAVRWAVDAGIKVSCSFMVPFPDDTEQTLAETFAFMRTLADAGAKVMISYTTPYPGTMFAERADDLGLNILSRDWGDYDAKHLVVDTKTLTAERIVELTTAAALSLGMQRSI